MLLKELTLGSLLIVGTLKFAIVAMLRLEAIHELEHCVGKLPKDLETWHRGWKRFDDAIAE